MRFDERIINCDDLYGTMLNTGVKGISCSSTTGASEKAIAGYLRIAEDDSANAAEAIDTDECLGHINRWSL